MTLKTGRGAAAPPFIVMDVIAAAAHPARPPDPDLSATWGIESGT